VILSHTARRALVAARASIGTGFTLDVTPGREMVCEVGMGMGSMRPSHHLRASH